MSRMVGRQTLAKAFDDIFERKIGAQTKGGGGGEYPFTPFHASILPFADSVVESNYLRQWGVDSLAAR